MSITTIEVRRDDLGVARVVTAPEPELREGEVLLRVERFGLSANNVTYGALGDRLGYWRFYPASGDGWGRIPAWGYAEVVRGPLAAGRRAFGYVPMASHVVLTPRRVSARGFLDGSAHRSRLPVAYNSYSDPGAGGDAQLLLRPLYMLSFLLDEALGDAEERVLVTSASSKTSLGFARLQAERGVAVTGLTSERNRAFVERVGVYDRVATYDDPPRDPAILVDVAGNAAVRAALKPTRTVIVGATHRHALQDAPGATLFFAPEELRRRRGEWGAAGFDTRFAAAFDALVEWSAGWLRVQHVEGAEAALDAYRAVARGDAGPDQGFILRLN